METSMASKTLCKVIRIAGQSLLAIFAAMFAMVSAACLIVAAVEGEAFSLIGCAACAFIAWVCWSARRDMIC